MFDRITARQISSFGGVGIIATVTHISVALGASELAGWSSISSNGAGAAIAFLVSFLGNAQFTFTGTRPRVASLWRYGLIAFSGFVIASGIMELVEWQDMHRLFYVLFVLLTVPPISFLLAKHWAYADSTQDRITPATDDLKD